MDGPETKQTGFSVLFLSDCMAAELHDYWKPTLQVGSLLSTTSLRNARPYEVTSPHPTLVVVLMPARAQLARGYGFQEM